MSVNIFGSSGSASKKVDTKCIDQKFIVLTTNLNTKVDRRGDTLHGPFDMVNHKITSTHIPVDDFDLVNKKYMDTLTSSTGDVSTLSLNTKLNKAGDSMTGDLNMGSNKVSSSHVPTNDFDLINKKHLDAVASHRLGDDEMRIIINNLSLKANRSGEVFTGHVDLGENKITSSYVPRLANDLLNKKYLSMRHVSNNVGYIPDMSSNFNNKGGFISSASSEYTRSLAHNAFNSWMGDWSVGTKTNMWIQIICPELVRIHKFAVRGKSTGTGTERIMNWSLQASKNGLIWVTLYLATNRPIGLTTQFFCVTSSPLASYYKLVVSSAEGVNLGLSFFQIYTYDNIEIPHLSEIADTLE